MPTDAERFYALFQGLRSAYGTYRTTTKTRVRDGKVEGQAHTIKRPLTLQHIEEHLQGVQGIGIVPIDDTSQCWWGAIDVDIYDLDLPEVVQRVHEIEVPLVVCRTKSGGAHLYLFLSEPAPAHQLRSKLTSLASVLGFGDSEIFPKQDALDPAQGDVGNWINMPYFNAEMTTRYALHPKDAGALELAAFLDLADQSKILLSKVEAKISQQRDTSDAFADGPPCLQVLAKQGVGEGARNKGLFAMGVYLRKRFESDWSYRLTEYNAKFMQPPLEPDEVSTIGKSLSGKEYYYPCKNEPICSRCDQATCRTRIFGVGNVVPRITALTKYNFRDNPLYDVDIEGVGRVRHISADVLLDLRRFRKSCVEQLDILFPMMKGPAWDETIKQILAEQITVDMEDAGTSGLFSEYYEAFMDTAREAKLEEVLTGTAVFSEGEVWFRYQDFTAFLRKQNFRDYGHSKTSSLLREMGAEQSKKRLRGSELRLWHMPHSIADQEPLSVPDMGGDVL